MLHLIPFPSHLTPWGWEGQRHLPQGLGRPGRDHHGLGDVSRYTGNPDFSPFFKRGLTPRRQPKADHVLAHARNPRKSHSSVPNQQHPYKFCCKNLVHPSKKFMFHQGPTFPTQRMPFQV